MIGIVRQVPSSFASALCAELPAEPIDVERARAQHADYVSGLRWLGVDDIVELPADDAMPDCCFVEDTAVVAHGIALIARPGAPSRRAETAAVRAALASRVDVHDMAGPATLDGGDCLLLGDRLYIGRSGRTNADGIARAREVFARVGVSVIEVAVTGALHLKSVCSPLGDDTIVTARGTLPPDAFAGVRVLEITRSDCAAANLVAHGSRALVAAGHPAAADQIAAAGWEIRAIDTSEMRKADGALTCLSVLVR